MARDGALCLVRGAPGHRPGVPADPPDRDAQPARRPPAHDYRGRRDRVGHSSRTPVATRFDWCQNGARYGGDRCQNGARYVCDTGRNDMRRGLDVARPPGLAGRRRERSLRTPGVLAAERSVVHLGLGHLSGYRTAPAAVGARDAHQPARGPLRAGHDGIDRRSRVVGYAYS